MFLLLSSCDRTAMSKITDFFNRSIIKPMAENTATPPTELDDAISQRDEALARAHEVREETQVIEKENESKRQHGVELEAANANLEKTNKSLLADREGAQAEHSQTLAELDTAKKELSSVKSALDEANRSLDETRTTHEQEKAQYEAWKANAIKEHATMVAQMDDEIGVKSRYKDALTKDAENAKVSLVQTNQEKADAIETMKAVKKHTEMLDSSISNLTEQEKAAQAKLNDTNEKVDEAQKELATVLDETATAKSDLAKATAQLDGKKAEIFAQSDRNRILDEREQLLKDRYKEAGLTYPE